MPRRSFSGGSSSSRTADWSFALHSLNLAEHVWKRVGEIDFLVVGPRGIYVLEVKGGGVSCERGIWRFTDRTGTAAGSVRALLARPEPRCSPCRRGLRNAMPRGLLSRVTFGYAVVFPDCDFTLESVEWSPEMVIDRRQLDRKDGVRRSLGRLASYWRGKPGSRNGLLGEAEIAEILGLLTARLRRGSQPSARRGRGRRRTGPADGQPVPRTRCPRAQSADRFRRRRRNWQNSPCRRDMPPRTRQGVPALSSPAAAE